MIIERMRNKLEEIKGYSKEQAIKFLEEMGILKNGELKNIYKD